MRRTRRFFKSSFGSAVLGGIVVGLFGWLAVAAGWIESDDGSAPVSAETAAAPPAAPAS